MVGLWDSIGFITLVAWLIVSRMLMPSIYRGHVYTSLAALLLIKQGESFILLKVEEGCRPFCSTLRLKIHPLWQTNSWQLNVAIKIVDLP